MVGTLSDQSQLDIFQPVLRQLVSPKHGLVILSEKLDWKWIELSLSSVFSHTGRPGHPIRRIVGLLILKQLENVSDETLIMKWEENIYWQYFTGESRFVSKCPVHSSELPHFRIKLGEEGIETIFQASIRIHGKAAMEKECVIDTTVQEKNITYPTDTKHRRKIYRKCILIAKDEQIQLRRTYSREFKECLKAARFHYLPNKAKESRRATKRMKTIVMTILRDLSRKLEVINRLDFYKEKIDMFHRVLSQKREDKNKIYSLHEPTVSCIAKGKEHKKYEFGCKVSILTTMKRGIIIGAKNFQGNPHDTTTLQPTFDQAKRLLGTLPERAFCDRGYRGAKEINNTQILIPDNGKTKSDYEKRRSREKFRKRAAIEPRISHLKYDHRMARNYLRGVLGDAVNLMMAATAWNLRVFLRLPGTPSNFFSWILKCVKEYARINLDLEEFFLRSEF